MNNFKTFVRFIPALLVASVAVGQIVAVEDKVSIIPDHPTTWGIEKLGPAYWPGN